MKKIITFALCLAAVGSMSAQKTNVDEAKKLSGKFDKIEDARRLIQQAMQDPTTSEDAETYYVAGKIEFDAYDNGTTKGMINPEDPAAEPVAMGTELLNGYKYYLMALPYDTVVDAKGKVKTKYSKDIVNKIAGHASDFFTSGAKLYDAKKYYPEAYECFMIFGDMPEMAILGNKAPKLVEADRGQSYFNAGLSAWSGNQLVKAADAFTKARQHEYNTDPNAYIYELACWQNLAANDSTMEEVAQARIFNVAQEGYNKFGIEQPVFLNNLVNTYVLNGQYNNALSAVNNLLAENPANSNLYGLLGFIYDRMDKDAESIDAYGKAVAIADCDFETLKNAAKKYLRVGTEELNKVEPGDRAGKMALKEKYFEPAKAIVDRARSMNAGDSDLNYVIENVDYALETYF